MFQRAKWYIIASTKNAAPGRRAQAVRRDREQAHGEHSAAACITQVSRRTPTFTPCSFSMAQRSSAIQRNDIVTTKLIVQWHPERIEWQD